MRPDNDEIRRLFEKRLIAEVSLAVSLTLKNLRSEGRGVCSRHDINAALDSMYETKESHLSMSIKGKILELTDNPHIMDNGTIVFTAKTSDSIREDHMFRFAFNQKVLDEEFDLAAINVVPISASEDTDIGQRYQRALSILREVGQEQLLAGWDDLNKNQKYSLLDDINRIDWKLLDKLYKKHVISQDSKNTDLRGAVPAEPIIARRKIAAEKGRTVLKWGAGKNRARYAGIVVAGGRGSGLMYDHPKGLFPAMPLSGQGLYDALIEKMRAAAAKYGHRKTYPLIFMVSDQTDVETVRYLMRAEYWDEIKDRVLFVNQTVLPVLRMETGKAFLKNKDHINAGGAGHGDAFDYVLDPEKTAYGKVWSEKAGDFINVNTSKWLLGFGVEYVQYMNVDNPLVPMADEYFIGEHVLSRNRDLEKKEHRAHISLGMIKKQQWDAACKIFSDRLGNVVLVNGRKESVDYGDTPDDLAAICEYGDPSFRIVTVSSLTGSIPIEYSMARKKDTSSTGEVVKIYKFERSSGGKKRYGVEFAYEYEDTFASIKYRDEDADRETPGTSRWLQSNHWKRLVRNAMPDQEIPESTIIELPWEADYMNSRELCERLTSLDFASFITPNTGVLILPKFSGIKTIKEPKGIRIPITGKMLRQDLHMSVEKDEERMGILLEELKREAIKCDFPVVAMLVNERTDQSIIGRRRLPESRKGAYAIPIHAEIDALQKAVQYDWNLSDCALYISLEPCYSCAKAIANNFLGIKRVVIGSIDPSPHLSGMGKAHLLSMGLETFLMGGELQKQFELFNENSFNTQKKDAKIKRDHKGNIIFEDRFAGYAEPSAAENLWIITHILSKDKSVFTLKDYLELDWAVYRWFLDNGYLGLHPQICTIDANLMSETGVEQYKNPLYQIAWDKIRLNPNKENFHIVIVGSDVNCEKARRKIVSSGLVAPERIIILGDKLSVMFPEEWLKKAVFRASNILSQQNANIVFEKNKKTGTWLFRRSGLDLSVPEGLCLFLGKKLEEEGRAEFLLPLRSNSEDSLRTALDEIILKNMKIGEAFMRKGIPCYFRFKKALIIPPYGDSEGEKLKIVDVAKGAEAVSYLLNRQTDDVDARVYNPNLTSKEELYEFVEKEHFDIIGFSILQTCLKATCEIIGAVHLISPNSIIVAGGHDVHKFPHKTLFDALPVDIFAFHGAMPIVRAAKAISIGKPKVKNLRKLKSIPGLMLCIGGGAVKMAGIRHPENFVFENMLEDTPFGISDLTHGKGYRHLEVQETPGVIHHDRIGRNPIRILLGDHCKGPCIFCAVERNKHKNPPVSEVMDIIRSHMAGYDSIHFQTNDFLYDKKYAAELCRALAASEFKDIPKECNVRTKNVDKDMLLLMKSAGIRIIAYGVESFDDEILKQLHKDTTAADNKKALEMAIDAGIKPIINVMLFRPWDTAQTLLCDVDDIVHYVKQGASLDIVPGLTIGYGSAISKSASVSEFGCEEYNFPGMKKPLQYTYYPKLKDTEAEKLRVLTHAVWKEFIRNNNYPGHSLDSVCVNSLIFIKAFYTAYLKLHPEKKHEMESRLGDINDAVHLVIDEELKTSEGIEMPFEKSDYAHINIPSQESASSLHMRSYIEGRFHPEMLKELKERRSAIIELHRGLHKQTEQYLADMKWRGHKVEELSRDYKGDHRFYMLTRENEKRFVISNIIGPSRELAIAQSLVYFDYPCQKIIVRKFDYNLMHVFNKHLGEFSGKINRAVIAHEIERFAKTLQKVDRSIRISKRVDDDHIKCLILKRSNGEQILLFEIGYANGQQIANIADYMVSQPSKGGLGINEINLNAACGAIDDTIEINDIILFSDIYLYGEKLKMQRKNDVRIDAFRQLLPNDVGLHSIPIYTIPTVMNGTSELVRNIQAKGGGAIELELAHIYRTLSKYPSVIFRVFYEAHDKPSADAYGKKEALGQHVSGYKNLIKRRKGWEAISKYILGLYADGEVKDRRQALGTDKQQVDANKPEFVFDCDKTRRIYTDSLGWIVMGSTLESNRDLITSYFTDQSIDLPRTIIIPSRLSDGRALLTCFPVIFNLIKGRPTNVIGTKDQIKRIKAVWRQTVTGATVEDLMAGGMRREDAEHFVKELSYYKYKKPNGEILGVDELANFVELEPLGSVNIVDVCIRAQTDGLYEIYEKGKAIGKLDGGLASNTTMHVNGLCPLKNIPDFGVTFLETGDIGTPLSTDLVLWYGKNAMLVDRGEFAGELLKELDIDEDTIEDYFITHVHDDHIAGMVSRIEYAISAGKPINILTTKVIFDSLTEIVKNVSDIDITRTQYIRFVELEPGVPTAYKGAVLEVQYGLHIVPTLMLKMRYHNKTVSYSSDSKVSDQVINELENTGIITKARKKILSEFIWDANLIIQECAGQPSHTKLSDLELKPASIKKKTVIVHTRGVEPQPSSMLRKACTGMTLDVENDGKFTGTFVVITGPSGAGKGAIIKRLHADMPDGFRYAVPYYTRPMRQGEEEGLDYHFVTDEEFKRLQATGEIRFFRKSPIGYLMGSYPEKEIRQAFASGDYILVQGNEWSTKELQRQYPKSRVIKICVLPLSEEQIASEITAGSGNTRQAVIENELLRRLAGRGTENKSTLKNRLKAGLRYYGKINDFEYVVINGPDAAAKASESLRAILSSLKKDAHKTTGIAPPVSKPIMSNDVCKEAERALIVIKPDGVATGLETVMSSLVLRLKERGINFRIVGAKVMRFSECQARKFYDETSPYFISENNTQGVYPYIRGELPYQRLKLPVFVFIVEGDKGITSSIRTLDFLGPTVPDQKIADPAKEALSNMSLRRALAYPKKSLPKNPPLKTVLNTMHVSGNEKEATRQIGILYTTSELSRYYTIDAIELMFGQTGTFADTIPAAEKPFECSSEKIAGFKNIDTAVRYAKAGLERTGMTPYKPDLKDLIRDVRRLEGNGYFNAPDKDTFISMLGAYVHKEKERIGRSGMDGIEMSEEYTRLFENAFKYIVAWHGIEKFSGIALCGFGSISRRMMTFCSDVDIAVMTDGSVDMGRISDIIESLSNDIKAVGYKVVDMRQLPWRDFEDYSRNGHISGRDVTKINSLSFLSGDRALFDKFKADNTGFTPERLRELFLLYDWNARLAGYYKNPAEDGELRFKRGEGGLWETYYLYNYPLFAEGKGTYDLKTILSILNERKVFGDQHRADKIREAISFLLQVKNAMEMYRGWPDEIKVDDLVKPEAAAHIAKIMQYSSAGEFMQKYKELTGALLLAINEIRRSLFNIQDAGKSDNWKRIRDGMLTEVFEVIAQGRLPTKSVLDEGLALHENIFNLCAARCSNDRDMLRAITKRTALEKGLKAESWPMFMAVASNPYAPQDVLIFLTDILKNAGPAWRHVMEAIYVNPGFSGLRNEKPENVNYVSPDKNPRMAKSFTANEILLKRASQCINGFPVDMSIDLTLVPQETLASNMRTWAYIAAINNKLGLNIKYILKGEPGYANDAKNVMNMMIDDISWLSAPEKNLIKGCVRSSSEERSADELRQPYKIKIENASSLIKGPFSVQDDLIVTMNCGVKDGNIPVLDFMAANTIALAQVACLSMKRNNPDNLGSFAGQQILPKIIKIYGRLLPNDIVTKTTLLNMVSDNYIVRRNLAVALAVPPITKVPAQYLADYQDSIHNLLMRTGCSAERVLKGGVSAQIYQAVQNAQGLVDSGIKNKFTEEDEIPMREKVINDYCEVERRSYAINVKNRDFLPRIEDKRILCHIIADAIIPDAQLQLMQDLQEESMKEKYKEKLVRLTADPAKMVNFMEKLKEKIQEQKKYYESRGYAVEFDIACSNVDIVKQIQDELKLSALAFDKGSGNFIQVENIMLALRALHSGDLDKLKSAFEFITGEKLPENLCKESDITVFIRKATFALKAITIEDYQTLKRLNDNIKILIKHA